MPLIGAHVSTSGGLHTCFQRAKSIGAQCMQLFLSPPQRWVQKTYSPEEIQKFKETHHNTQIGPNFIHGIYLINLAAENPSHLHLSKEWLIYAQNMAEELGLRGTIFHLGSHRGKGFKIVQDQICQSLETIMEKSPQNPYLILENSAGAGGSIGGKLQELGVLIKTVNDPRLKVCLDTQHAFASGYELRTQSGVESLLEEFDKEIGLDKLAVIHANDSKTDFNSGRDRHENIGEGSIGLEAFRSLINHPQLKDVPFLLEVPGYEDQGPDKNNIDTLKGLMVEY